MRPRWSVLVAMAAVLAGVIIGTASATGSPGPRVVVERGKPVRVVVAIDRTGVGAPFAQGIRNAIQQAADRQGSIRGFTIELVEAAAPCGEDAAALDANTAVASAVVADTRNAAVIGHMCSAPFVGALPLYEAARVVTINGSATRPGLPALAPTTFNRTVVNDDEGSDSWYGIVQSTPVNVRWRIEFEQRFGLPPTDFADLYFDAAAILLQRLEQVSRLDRGRLVIDRSELARAVRATRGFPGVTCSVTLEQATGNRVNDTAALEKCRRIPAVPTVGERINLQFGTPATFPAFTPFHIWQGALCFDTPADLADCFDPSTRFELFLVGPGGKRFRVPATHAAGWGWAEHPTCTDPAMTCVTDYSSFWFGLPPGTYTFEGTWYLRGEQYLAHTRTITFTR